MDIINIISTWAPVSSVAGAGFALLGCIYSYKSYKKMTHKRVSCSNGIALSDDKKCVLKIKIRNKGSALGLDTIALNLTTCDSSPRLNVNIFLKARRMLRHIFGRHELIVYASDSALRRASKTLPTTLSEEEPFLCEIELDQVMQAIIDANESYGSKRFLFVCLFGLKLHVVTGSGLWVFPVDPEAKFYLWQRFKDNPALTT